MRRLITALMLAIPALAAAATPEALPKEAEQGQLILARTDPGSRVQFAGRQIKVSSDGVFAIGIAYDAPKQVQVRIRAPGGKARNETIAIKQRHYETERVDGLPPETVTPDAKTAKRIRAEQGRVAAARERNDDRTDFLDGFKRPEGKISAVYGSKRIDNGHERAPHLGLDFAAGTGTPIVSPAPGIVTLAEPDFVMSGGTVLVDHGHGISSSFLHLSRIDAKVGDTVKRGQTLGLSGATGRATGPHIHWGVNWFTTRVDPALLPQQ